MRIYLDCCISLSDTHPPLRAPHAEEGKGAKLVVKLQDGMLVETVIINHRHESSGRERNTVCVSSQVRPWRQDQKSTRNKPYESSHMRGNVWMKRGYHLNSIRRAGLHSAMASVRALGVLCVSEALVCCAMQGEL